MRLQVPLFGVDLLIASAVYELGLCLGNLVAREITHGKISDWDLGLV